MIIAIDFDGTITDSQFTDFPATGNIMPGARRVINYLHDQLGIKIIIWTCRSLPAELEAMKKFLKDNGVQYDAINANNFVPFVNTPKIYADIYIDDRQAGGLPGTWDGIYEVIKPAIKAAIGKTHKVAYASDIPGNY